MANDLDRRWIILRLDAMTLLDDLQKFHRLRGDTYSSAEAIRFVGLAAAEIERLQAKIVRVRQINGAPSDPRYNHEIAAVLADEQKADPYPDALNESWER